MFMFPDVNLTIALSSIPEHPLDVLPVKEVDEGKVPEDLLPHHGAVLPVHHLVGHVILILMRREATVHQPVAFSKHGSL